MGLQGLRLLKGPFLSNREPDHAPDGVRVALGVASAPAVGKEELVNDGGHLSYYNWHLQKLVEHNDLMGE